MRIGILADPPFLIHSCAIVGDNIAKRLTERGHEVHYLGFNFRGINRGETVEFHGYKVHPDTGKFAASHESITNFIEDSGIEILFGHGCHDIFRGCVTGCRACGIPFVPQTFWDGRGFDFRYLRQADKVIVVNRFSKDLFEKTGILDVEFIPNGVDISLFFPENSTNSEEFVIFANSTNTYWKHPNEVMKACLKLNFKFKLIYLLGSVEGHYALDKYIRKLGDRLELISTDKKETFIDGTTYSQLPQAEVAKLYQKADLFVHASLHEGMNLCILEALSSGLPVICSANPTVSEPVIDNQQGFHFYDHSEIANLITFAYRHRNSVLKLIKKHARRRAVQQYNWDLVIYKIEKTLERVLDGF